MFPRLDNVFFFVNDKDEKLKDPTVRRTFMELLIQIGLRKKTDHHGPTIHGLRHTFTVQTIIRWYKEDRNIDSLIPILSTYLGHALPSYTYWYLTGTPELLSLAALRLEKYHGGK